jgi:hypothetical protein
MTEPNQTDLEGRLAAHDAKGYRDRGAVERAISGFLAAKMRLSPRNVSVEEVRDFILHSPDYLPLLAALKEAVDAR